MKIITVFGAGAVVLMALGWRRFRSLEARLAVAQKRITALESRPILLDVEARDRLTVVERRLDMLRDSAHGLRGWSADERLALEQNGDEQ